MTWQLLESSVFAAAAYHAGKQTLYLRFRSGELYRYFDFPPESFSNFLAAESKGRYFAEHIRESFACEHLPRSDGASASRR